MRILLSIIATMVLLQSCTSDAHQPASTSPKEIIPVKLIPVNSDSGISTIQASGLLSTETDARLSFKIGGIIESIFVKEGDKIRRGQLLATLKSTEIAAQVSQVKLGLEKAERDLRRAENLYKDSVATLEQLQNARTAYEVARQNLQQVSFNSEYSRIIAPADGFVVKKLANAGELASPGTAVLQISGSSASSPWIVKAGLPDHEWAIVEKGDAATVRLDAFPGKQFAAVISKKTLAADPQSGSFTVELQVRFNGEQPALGMFGNVVIKPSRQSTGVSIPYEALLEADGRKGYVFVSDDEKTVKKVEVQIASISNNVVYISSGLEGHRFVVGAGSPYLSDNTPISVVR